MISDIQMHDSLDRAAQARLQLEAAAAGVRKLEPEDKLGVRMHLSLVSMKLDVFAGHIRTASELALDVSPEQALALNVAPHAVVRDMRVVLNEQAEKLALGEQVNPREFFPALELLASRAIDRTDALVREVDAERSLSRRRESDLAVH